MSRPVSFLLFAGIILFFLKGCNSSAPTIGNGIEISEDGNKIILTDRTGKKWDVSHAVNHYGFDVNRFEFGLGPFAIQPFLNPEFLSPGDAGYPSDNADFLVMGTAINGDARAYKISDMSWHEVADDTFGDTHVAVAY